MRKDNVFVKPIVKAGNIVLLRGVLTVWPLTVFNRILHFTLKTFIYFCSVILRIFILNRILPVLLLCVFVLNAQGQKMFTVTGVTFKSASQTREANVLISNLTRKTTVRSDGLGIFRIQAAAGDSLMFTKLNYTPHSIVVFNDDLLTIYIQPIVILNEVKINDLSTRQELALTMDNYRKSGQYSSLRPGVVSSILSPVSGLYSLFGKAPNRARRFEAFSKRELEQVEIEKRYNKGVIQKVVEIPEKEISDFMMAFTPSYEQIKIWSDYDIIKYIQTSYAYFEKNKTNLKPQKLY